MIALGVDPGFASVGLAIVELAQTEETVRFLGVLRTVKSDKKRSILATEDNLRRAQELAEQLERMVGTLGVQFLCLESMSFPRNASAAAKVAMCWGVLASLAQRNSLAVVQSSPQEVKLAVAGVKSASKEQVRDALLVRYPGVDVLLRGVPNSIHEHAYDALGTVVSGLNSQAVKLARKRDGG